MLITPVEQQCYTLEEIHVGQRAEFDLRIDPDDVEAFAQLSSDRSDLHLSDEFARRSRFRSRVAHGMLPLTAVSTLVGMALPDRHALLLAVDASFLTPIRLGDLLRVRGTILSKSTSTRIIKLQVMITNQRTGHSAMEAVAEVFVHPPPRKGVPMLDVAKAIVMLASPFAQYTTGHQLMVTGGAPRPPSPG